MLALSGLLVAVGLLFHPVPSGGFEERASVLANTPWWGPIHIAIAAGFVGCLLGSLLILVAGGDLTHPWPAALSWGAMAVGMIFFTGVALINGWVMHYLTAHGAPTSVPLLYDAFNRLLLGYGWLGNPLFLAGLTGIAFLELRHHTVQIPLPLAWAGLVVVVLSWGRGIGSATGLYFLEPLIFANVPAFLWLAYYGLRVARAVRLEMAVVLLVGIGFGAVPSVARAQSAARPNSRPNVVLILMDDLGYGDLGSYGVADAKTPNLDRLAREGVRLTDAYANASNCSPTRAGLITGQYQQRHGIEWPLGSVAGDSARGLRATGASLPALLKTNGYATGLIGKWHLGDKPEFGPNAHGFDEFFGFVGGAVDYYTHRRGDGTPDLYENTTPVEVPGYLTDEITRRAVSFVDRHASAPFFLEVAYNAVHWPFQPPDMQTSDLHAVPRSGAVGDQRLYQGPNDSVPATRADYVRMLERADLGVGQILKALEQHRLAPNTVVIFTNDNGGEWLSRNAPLSNRKSTLWEGGIRVPLFMRWPGVLPANKTSAQVAITMDLTATILAATGTTNPANHPLDGIDLLPSMSGRSPIVERRLFWRRLRPTEQRAVRSGRWKLLQDGVNLYLFDVAQDAGERNDLTAARPDLVRMLSAALDQWEKEVGRAVQSR